MKKGEGWLKEHPEKEQIIRRYLINLNSLSKQALERLSEGEEIGDLSDDLVEKTEKQKRKETLHYHGELFGEAGYFGHGPIMHEKCFEVPFLEGKIR